ncbi:FkbM family methyltransferase [Castellaniella sp. FW104-16D08]|uniref:FkbM family methyltransferase n=1 Tax=unclassified Castellaniella TaxID=2617606 RepID=UPI003314AEAF
MRQTDWPVRFAQLGRKIAVKPTHQIDRDRDIWLFGAGQFGQDLARAMRLDGLRPSGFIETNPNKSEVGSLPVCSWQDFVKKGSEAQVVLAVFNRSAPYDDLRQIAVKAGSDIHHMPWDIYGAFGGKLGWRFWLEDPVVLAKNMDRISQVAMQLADEESRLILYRVCAFRAGLDLEFSSFKSTEYQYFNNLTLPGILNRKISYVDCGAYNGDTYVQLCKSGIVCERAYLLEPDSKNFSRLAHKMRGRAETVCLPLAASDCQEMFSFNAGGQESSAFSTAGNTKVTAVSLDQLFCASHLDFIKLDVEGAEAAVLSGAKELIKRSRPIIAASLYHNPHDIWMLPEILFDLCQDYDYYVRQHFFNSFDLVLYAIPRSID